MEKITVINIYWENFNPDPKDFFKEIRTLNKENEDYGIYQIYGHHHAYGDNTLLYIGKAEERTFSVRLSVDDRSEFWTSSCRPTSIRLGKLVKSDNEETPVDWDIKDWGKMINVAEILLIKSHSPALNRKDNTGRFDINSFGNEQYLVINWNDYGKLLPEVSSLRMSYRYWDYETYITN
jgi:hypothetical protein